MSSSLSQDKQPFMYGNQCRVLHKDASPQRRSRAFRGPPCCSNQSTAISLEISLLKFNSRGRSTAVPFPNWNSPPCVFGKHRCLGVLPVTITRDCSQLWMVLVDFSSNKNHESFHNFWNCKEITLWLRSGGGHCESQSSKLKHASFFIYWEAAHCQSFWQWKKKEQVSVLVLGAPLCDCP